MEVYSKALVILSQTKCSFQGTKFVVISELRVMSSGRLPEIINNRKFQNITPESGLGHLSLPEVTSVEITL